MRRKAASGHICSPPDTTPTPPPVPPAGPYVIKETDMVHGRSRWIFIHAILMCASVLSAWIPVAARAAQATLSWSYTASGAAGFVLYCGTSSGSYSTRVDVGNTTTYTISGLIAGTTYYCATTAYDAAKRESAYSAELVLPIPASPTTSGAPQVAARTPAAF